MAGGGQCACANAMFLYSADADPGVVGDGRNWR